MAPLAPAPSGPSLLVAGLRESGGTLPELPLTNDPRGPVLRPENNISRLSEAMPQLASAGHRHFPRHSAADVICCLRKWN